MKLVPLRDFGALKAREVLKAQASVPGRGIDLEEMRKRVRILDAIEKAKDQPHMLLEDADHAELVAIVKGPVWGAASKDLLELINDVLAASEPPETQRG